MSAFPQRLIDGYRAFTTQRLPIEQSRYRALSERGQSPETMVVGCCDLCVSPEVIFDAKPGELFVVRNIANLVPVYQPDASAHGISAALEFGVEVLKVKHIVILGHAQCSGISAIINKAAPQRERETMKEFATRIEKATVFRSIENLMTFPFVQRSVESGHLRLHGAYFGIAEGSLYALDRETKEFRSVGDNSLV